MCCIFGISYNKKSGMAEKLSTGQIARIMGENLVHGGPHAFGWMQNVGGKVAVKRFPGRIDTQLEKLFSIKRECDWFVGHVRFATHGDSNDLRNVHPILHDNILGVHNGVLNNHEAVLKDCGGRMDAGTQVDSEAIFAAVQHFGHEKGLAKLYGSMVAVYTDLRKPKSIFVARSQNRQLRIGWTARGNLIFASEQGALDALEDAGIEFLNFSGISENRVLRIADGDIRERSTFRMPSSQFPAREAAKAARNGTNTSDDVLASYGQSRANKRGAMLFPPAIQRELDDMAERHGVRRHVMDGAHTEPLPQNRKRPVKRNGTAHEVGVIVSPGKVKYKGAVMTQDEYMKLRSMDLAEAVASHPASVSASEEDWEE